MTWDGPYLPVDLTLTTASDPLTWTRSRLECSAWTLTALLAQVVTAIEPPKLFTSRRAPGRTRNVVSVWASAAAIAAARIVIMQLSSSALRAGEGGRPAPQLQPPPHRVGAGVVEVGAAPGRRERAPRARSTQRSSATGRPRAAGRRARAPGPRRAAALPASPHRPRNPSGAPRALRAPPRRACRPRIPTVGRSSCPSSSFLSLHLPCPHFPTCPHPHAVIDRGVFSAPSAHGAAAISTFPRRCRACRR